MTYDFSGRRAFVTGSTKGIGLSIAQSFLLYGADVILNGRSPCNLAHIIPDVFIDRSSYFQGDLTDPSVSSLFASRLVDDNRKIDILICNVGSGSSVPPGHETYEEFQRVFDLNFFASFNIINSFLRSDVFSPSASIIWVSLFTNL